MAKENIAKFYEALARDKALAEKLAAADKAYAETHELPAADADEVAQLAFCREAAKEIILPIAAEAGFPFTVEEMEAFEKEQIATLQMSDDELDQVAGGGFKLSWGYGHHICKDAGIGFGLNKVDGEDSVDFCATVGKTDMEDSKENSKLAVSYCCFVGFHWS